MAPSRFGPPAIPPRSRPGGILVHVYDDNGILLACHDMVGPDECSAAGEAVGHMIVDLIERHGEMNLTSVAYDGDNGLRLAARTAHITPPG